MAAQLVALVGLLLMGFAAEYVATERRDRPAALAGGPCGREPSAGNTILVAQMMPVEDSPSPLRA